MAALLKIIGNIVNPQWLIKYVSDLYFFRHYLFVSFAYSAFILFIIFGPSSIIVYGTKISGIKYIELLYAISFLIILKSIFGMLIFSLTAFYNIQNKNPKLGSIMKIIARYAFYLTFPVRAMLKIKIDLYNKNSLFDSNYKSILKQIDIFFLKNVFLGQYHRWRFILLLLDAKLYNQIENHFNKMIKSPIKNSDALLILAENFMQNANDFEKGYNFSYICYEKILSLDPKNITALKGQRNILFVFAKHAFEKGLYDLSKSYCNDGFSKYKLYEPILYNNNASDPIIDLMLSMQNKN